MIDLALFFAAVWGVSAGLAFSKLLVGPRAALGEGFWGQLVGCPMCTGFHLGWIAVAASVAPGPHTVFYAAVLAFACAGINLILAVITEKLSS